MCGVATTNEDVHVMKRGKRKLCSAATTNEDCMWTIVMN